MSWTIASIAAAILAYAAISGRLARSPVTPALFFVSLGLLLGPALGLIEGNVRSGSVKLLAEATLTLVLFADASRVSLRALRDEYAVPARLLGIGLPLTIAAGALMGAAVLPGVTLAEALVLSIMLACTDAALGQAVVTDERIPSRIRQGLNVESGLNDGLCVPLFWIAIALAEARDGNESAHSALELVLHEVGYGIVGGVVAGTVGGLALRTAVVRRLVAPDWLQILTAATALLAAGIAVGLGGSIFIAAFVGGLIFGGLRDGRGGEATYLVDEGGELLNAVTFVVFGAAILGPVLDELTWRVGLYAVLSLTVVRLVPVALAMLGTGARGPTVAFLGWFGPRGLASIVFGVILLEDTTVPGTHTMLLAVIATVGLSVYAHGLSARPLTERYVRWYEHRQDERAPGMESIPAAPQRWRSPRAAAALLAGDEPGL